GGRIRGQRPDHPGAGDPAHRCGPGRTGAPARTGELMARAVRERPAGRRSPMEDRILASAVALFAEQGFDATTVQQVVDRAEVTKGALYHYFDSKDDLLYELYHALIGVQNAEIERIVA